MSAPRRNRRSHGWVALCTFVCSLALPIAGGHPQGSDDDRACLVEAGFGTRASLQVGAPGPGHEPLEHCLSCHWLRAMSGAVASDVVALVSPSLATSGRRLIDLAALGRSHVVPASRAPPAFQSI